MNGFTTYIKADSNQLNSLYTNMTNREIIYQYLSGGISNRSFRKWLLELTNDDNFFLELDFKQLKTLAVIFSDPTMIKNILKNYINISIVEKLVLAKQFHKLIVKDEDILIKLEKLGDIGKQLKNINITNFVKLYKEIFLNTPRLIERKNWEEEIFLEKRRIVDKHQEKIMKKIIKFNKLYYFEYKERV